MAQYRSARSRSLGTGPGRRSGSVPPKTLVNLRVLPKDSRPGDVIATMRSLTQALGVRCQFCHVGREGQPLDQFDFVSDVVDKKTVARAMLVLVGDLNAQVQKAVPAAAAVTCYTCHQGARQPRHAPEPAALLERLQQPAER